MSGRFAGSFSRASNFDILKGLSHVRHRRDRHPDPQHPHTSAFDRAVEEAVEAKASAVKAQNLVQQKQFQADQVVATANGAAGANPNIIPYSVATHGNGKLPTTTVGSGSSLFRVLLPAAARAVPGK